MKNPIGTAKMSNWPKEILEYIDQAPEKKVYFGQSINSEHKLMRATLAKREVFISYNERQNIFVAWNVPIQLHQRQLDEMHVKFSLGKSILGKIGKNADVKFKTVYKRTGSFGTNGNVYEKIILFSPKYFEYFFNHYEKLMKPNLKDDGYQSPTFDFCRTAELSIAEMKK